MSKERQYDDECGLDHGGTNRHGDPCGRPAGWGTEFESGKCRNHRGTNEDGSSHEGNGNAITHGVTADPLNLYTHLDDNAKEWVDGLADGYNKILGFDEDDPRRERVTRACIHIYQANSGEGQILEDGLSESQTIGVSESGQPVVRDEEHHLNPAVLKRDKEARQILRTLGAFDDPESQKADAMEESLAVILSKD